MLLEDLFNAYGTDKGINGYASLYHILFSGLRFDKIDFLEIGIGTLNPTAASSMRDYCRPGYKPGGSLRAWRDFFPNGNIVGADVQPDTQFSEERIQTTICDSTNSGAVKAAMKELNRQWDICIDDGLHTSNAQILTLENFFPFVKKDGLYIIEDVYPGSPISENPVLVSMACNGNPFFFAGKLNNLCIIQKIKD